MSPKKVPTLKLNANPLIQFKSWFKDAQKAKEPIPESMIVATATSDGFPTARVMLLKDVSKGGFVFFTNYESRKAEELTENPYGTIVFHWPLLERQVRIEGIIEKTPRKESIAYFKTRPRGSQIGAWASPQSSAISDRAVLEDAVEAFEKKFKGKEVPCPEHWGGFRLIPYRIEFWQGRQYRLHDRFVYVKKGSRWALVRLAP